MFPDLAPKLKDAARVEITHQGKQTVIEKRSDGGWGLASMHDYPVQDTKLRGLLTGLTELRLTEPRTSDPAQFARLGVGRSQRVRHPRAICCRWWMAPGSRSWR